MALRIISNRLIDIYLSNSIIFGFGMGGKYGILSALGNLLL
jgi:hypothetical protein